VKRSNKVVKKTKQGFVLVARAVIGIIPIGVTAVIIDALIDGIFEETISFLGIALLTIFGLIFICLTVCVYFIGYCPRCKLVPTVRILRCFWDRSYTFTFTCPKCNSNAY